MGGGGNIWGGGDNNGVGWVEGEERSKGRFGRSVEEDDSIESSFTTDRAYSGAHLPPVSYSCKQSSKLSTLTNLLQPIRALLWATLYWPSNLHAKLAPGDNSVGARYVITLPSSLHIRGPCGFPYVCWILTTCL